MPTTPADGRRLLPRRVAGLVMLGVIGWLALALASVLIVPGLLHPLLPESELQRLNLDQQVQRQQEQRKLQNEARAALIQGLVGLLALSGAAIGASVAWRQLQENRRHQQHNEELSQKQLELSREQLRQALDASQEQLRLTQEELRLTREGHVTERFTRAIDQLGSDHLDVRLGGIYALERISNDSRKDQATVAEVLSAFVRGHAPWPPTCPGQYVEDASIEAVRPLRQWAPDVQAALTVLGRCERPRGPRRLDLTSTDLRRALLGDANLQYTDLTGARLQRADLYRAQLQEAKLVGAHLQGAYLVDAQLQDAMLEAQKLAGVELEDARLDGAQCSVKTRWPDGFDWKKAGVTVVE